MSHGLRNSREDGGDEKKGEKVDDGEKGQKKGWK